jgi:hypothetical protein
MFWTLNKYNTIQYNTIQYNTIPLDLSGLGGSTSSYATAGIALWVSGTLKPHHHDKVGITAVAEGPYSENYKSHDVEFTEDLELKPSLCQIEHHFKNTCWGRGIAPRIPNLRNKWKCASRWYRLLGKNSPVPIAQEGEWSPDQVWTLWRTEIGSRRAYDLVTVHCLHSHDSIILLHLISCWTNVK